MHWWGHIFKVPQIPPWSRIPSETMLPPPSTISTTSQHILHLLDQFRYHHCAPSLHKKSPLNSGHTFVVYTATTDFWQMDFIESAFKLHPILMLRTREENQITDLNWFLGGRPVIGEVGVVGLVHHLAAHTQVTPGHLSPCFPLLVNTLELLPSCSPPLTRLWLLQFCQS